MRNIIFTLMITFIGINVNHTYAQETSSLLSKESPSMLSIEANLFRENYFLNGNQISRRQLLMVLGRQPEAKADFRKARRSELWANWIASFGGGLVIGTLIDAGVNDRMNWASLAISGAILGSGLILWNQAIVNKRNSVDLYNYLQNQNAFVPRKRYLSFKLAGPQLSLQYNF